MSKQRSGPDLDRRAFVKRAYLVGGALAAPLAAPASLAQTSSSLAPTRPAAPLQNEASAPPSPIAARS